MTLNITSLEAHIKELIKNKGHITVAEYMALCLGHEQFGYYNRKDPFGVKGDFITAPEISQMFGEMLALWCTAQWKNAGCPQDVAVVELGPGRGTLMQDFLRATKKITADNGARFHDAISVYMVEMSPKLKKIQQEKLASEEVDIEWHDGFETVPEKPMLLIANEFFDALPVHQFVKTADDWRERVIGHEEGRLIMKTLDEEGLNFDLVPKNLSDLRVGTVYESSPQSVLILSEIARRLKRNGIAAVIIDYGYNNNPFRDSLQAVRNHEYYPMLATPGEADITAHVNFALLKKAAEKAGISGVEVMTQGEFLKAAGIEIRADMLIKNANEKQQKDVKTGLERLVSAAQMGSLFKVLTIINNAK